MTMTDQPLVHPGLGAQALPSAPTPVQPPAAGGGAAASLRDTLAADLANDTAKPDVHFAVRGRPGYEITYSPMLDFDLLKLWAKEATGSDGAPDQFLLSLRTLAGQCRGIRRSGTLLVLDGQPVTFASDAISGPLGTLDILATVRAFFGDDTTVATHYAALLEAANEGNELDPTTGSSD